jgi:hypothetical protein
LTQYTDPGVPVPMPGESAVLSVTFENNR